MEVTLNYCEVCLTLNDYQLRVWLIGNQIDYYENVTCVGGVL